MNNEDRPTEEWGPEQLANAQRFDLEPGDRVSSDVAGLGRNGIRGTVVVALADEDPFSQPCYQVQWDGHKAVSVVYRFELFYLAQSGLDVILDKAK